MIGRVLVLTAVLAATGLGVRGAAAVGATPLPKPLASIPLRIDNWRGRDTADLDPATVAVLGADEYVSRVYVDPSGTPVQLFVAYYASQRSGEAMHSPMNCLPGAGWQLLSTGRVPLDRGAAGASVVNRDIAQKGRERLLVFYWFQSHGRVVASEYWSKAYLVLDGLRLRRTDAALVRVVAPMRAAADAHADARATAFAGAAARVVTGYLPN